jgi:hypothetical protein
MERIAMDILGPLPKTERNSRYILLIGDYFTKWVEGVAISDQEAKTIARALLDTVIFVDLALRREKLRVFAGQGTLLTARHT